MMVMITQRDHYANEMTCREIASGCCYLDRETLACQGRSVYPVRRERREVKGDEEER